MDQISLKGMEFCGHHGCSQKERDYTQKFIVDLTLSLDLSKAGNSDNLADTVNYVWVFEDVKSIVTEQSFNLIETLAEEIADTIFVTYAPVKFVTVTVHKPNVPIDGKLDGVAVTIARRNPYTSNDVDDD